MANYDQAAYTTRHVANFVNVAPGTGALAQAGQMAFPWSVKVHSLSAVVTAAGTVTNAAVALMNGTTTVASLTCGTATASSVFSSTSDVNYTVPSNGVLAVIGVTDHTLAASVDVEYNLVPTATWLGTE